jgi:hypothetical protein
MTASDERTPVAATGSALIECPVHGDCVVLGDDGRIKTRCLHCLNEARHARKLWSDRRYRARLRAVG